MNAARFLFCIVGIAAISAAPLSADSINDLYDTGVGANRVSLPDGTSPDPHYSIVDGGDGSVANTTNIFNSVFWMPGSSTSAWVTPTSVYQYLPNGPFDYQTTFTLPSNADSVSISLNLAADDEVLGILLNGMLVDIPPSTVSTPIYTPISFSSNNVVAGVNILTFETLNFDPFGGINPTGLRVDGITGSYTVVPEPASIGLLGFALLLFCRRSEGPQ